MSSSDHEPSSQGTSTRPYLIRALHDWCTDNGFTPYVAVYVDRTVQVPMEYVKNNEIVLNVSFEATSQLQLGNEFIEFKARFGGSVREISVPVDHVIAIYARENGQGMAFPVPGLNAAAADHVDQGADAGDDEAAASTSDAPERTPLRLASVPDAAESADGSTPPGDDPEPPPSGGARPTLRRIK
jgi:stringent starvation protein B